MRYSCRDELRRFPSEWFDGFQKLPSCQVAELPSGNETGANEGSTRLVRTLSIVPTSQLGNFATSQLRNFATSQLRNCSASRARRHRARKQQLHPGHLLSRRQHPALG